MLFSLFNYINAQKVEILHGMTKYFCKNQRKHGFYIKKLLIISLKTNYLYFGIAQDAKLQ